MRPHASLFLLALLAPPAAAMAQQLPEFQVGDTLRVRAPRERLPKTPGTFVAWADSALVLRTTRPDSVVAVPFSAVVRLDRYGGKNRLAGALRGAGILGTVGLLTGALIGKAAVSGCGELLCELDALGYAAAGLGIGVLIGVPVGATTLAPDRWRRVELPPALGFPEYGTAFYQTTAFRILLVAGAALLLTATGN